MKNIFKNAFTLAEIMIVLTVIGILTAILLPTAFHSTPDENVMKFKKANATLYNVVRQLVGSKKYYKDGNLSVKQDGTFAGKSTFCESFADVISTKSVSCDYETGYSGNGLASAASWESGSNFKSTPIDKAELDRICKTAESSLSGDIGVKATDDVIYFEATLKDFFGCLYNQTCDYSAGWTGMDGISLYNGKQDIVMIDNGIKTNRFYRIFCIDVDGINKDEEPFGYGIRADGKILTGARADEWLEKSVQNKD